MGLVEESSEPSLSRRASFRAATPVVIASAPAAVLTRVEESLLKSPAPLPINDAEPTIVNGQRGFLLNKAEISNWTGPVPLSQYRIQEDHNPEVIRRQQDQPIEYNQDISVRYLRPPTPVTGEIVIRQEQETVAVPAPPLIMRKEGGRALTPPPIVIREEPPALPQIDRKVISVTSGKAFEYPARRLITEIIPPLPPKPPQIIIEKWLNYPKQRRRVIYEGARTRSTTLTPQRNLNIVWEQQPTVVKKGIRYLGVSTVDPVEYRSRYGSSLRSSSDMPSFVLDHERISKLSAQDVKYTKDFVIDKLETVIDRGYRNYYATSELSPVVTTTVSQAPAVSSSSSYVTQTPAVVTSSSYLSSPVVASTSTASTLVSSGVIKSGYVLNSNVPIEYFGDVEALKLLDAATLEREGLSDVLRTTSIKL